MTKNSLIIILGIIALLLLVYALYPKNSTNDRAKDLEATLGKLQHNLNVLSLRDTTWSKTVKKIRDSLVQERQNVAFWRDRYHEPITVTKIEIKEVFKQDSATITREVKKGVICDSLQRKQFLEIGTLSNALVSTDSLLKTKKLEIKFLEKKDSVNSKLEENLRIKIKKRTVGEVALGALAILLVIFGK